jgi:hypothetical protein
MSTKTAIQTKYEDAEDIDDLCGEYDPYTLRHSKDAGYFLSKYVRQKWNGHIWETIDEAEYGEKHDQPLLPRSIKKPSLLAMEALRK